MQIAFLTKKDKLGVEEAIEFTRTHFDSLDVFFGSRFDEFPDSLRQHSYDIIISYISSWIVPKVVLERTRKWNINFHPGPPEYPGTGCFNFAIYNEEEKFGTTAHIMMDTVDIGEIIGINRFPIERNETVESLSLKTYSSILMLYKEIITHIVDIEELPKSKEIWKRKPYKRSELEELATIDTKMDKKEIDKRIRATYYPGKPAPFVEFAGYRFEYNPKR